MRRAEQVAKEIVCYSQNNGTQKSMDFALEEIDKYFELKQPSTFRRLQRQCLLIANIWLAGAVLLPTQYIASKILGLLVGIAWLGLYVMTNRYPFYGRE